MIQILVVEDEVIVGIALREDLQDVGALAIVSHDAESALHELDRAAFDAAIIDVGLPGMRGDELARACRLKFPKMSIVLATGMNEREIRFRLEVDPMCIAIEKPHDFQQLLACLARLGIQLPQTDV